MKKMAEILGVIAVAVSLIIGALVVKNKIQPSPSTPTPIKQNSQTPANSSSIILVNANPSWEVGQEYTISVEMATLPSVVPDAYSIQLLFDPAKIKVVSAENGNIWTDANVLPNDKPPLKPGEFRFVAGQGFGSTSTGNTTLASVTVMPTTSGQTFIQLGSESQLATRGQATTLNAAQLTVNVN